MVLDPYQARACIFDFGGTLDSDGMTWQDRFYPIYLSHGVTVDRETFRHAFYYADDTLIEKRTLMAASLGQTVESQVSLVLDYLGLLLEEERKKEIALSFLEDTKKIINRNRRVLSKLSRRFRMAIVSNFYGNLERVCEDLGIRAFFDVIVDSTLVGIMKPDPRIFKIALERLGISPDQGLFIGDNQFRDMEGAKAIGMPHVWLATHPVGPPMPCCPDDGIISSLLELEGLLLGEEYKTPAEDPV
jgi:putative hydrolase of the HAD superfamily